MLGKERLPIPMKIILIFLNLFVQNLTMPVKEKTFGLMN